MSEAIRVAVVGACGKMGREVVKAVSGAADMALVGACDVAGVGERLGGVVVEADCLAMLDRLRPHVMVDFAKPYAIENTRAALQRGVVPIVGTTGQAPEELAEIAKLSESAGVGAMVIPNFAVGAVLMMKFAAQAAAYMPDVEIVELHHDRKADAPSGTSIKTAGMIDETRRAAGVQPTPQAGGEYPARGEECANVRVHSIRLPGLVAHQEVIFGGPGQILTIRHDSLDRTSFMPGVLLAVRRAAKVRGLVYGLDKLL